MTPAPPAPPIKIEAIRTKAGYPRWLAFNVPAVVRVFHDTGWRYDSANKVWWTEVAAKFVSIAQGGRICCNPSSHRAMHCSGYIRNASTAITPALLSIDFREGKHKFIPEDIGPFKLREYQRAGVQWLLTHKRTILGDEMGIGKTLQAIAAAMSLNRHVYVFCPSALAVQWEDVIKSVSPDCDPRYVRIVNTHTLGDTLCAVWTIIPYGALSADLQPSALRALKEHAKGTIAIVDEAHMLGGSGEAKRTLEALGPDGIATKCEYIWALTGTPITSSAINLLPLVQAMRPSLISKDEFQKQFCTLRQSDFGETWGGLKNEKELYSLLRESGLLMRRLKADVLTELPEKTRTVVRLPQLAADDTSGGALYAENYFARSRHLTTDQLVEAVAVGDHRGWGTELSQLRMQSTAARSTRIVEYVQTLIDAGAERVLVYCQFQQSADALANVYIARVGVGEAVAFHGGYGPGERDARLECFKRGKAHVLFATMQSAGTGIDGLQGVCDTAVIVEYPWNPGSMWQAEDRLHRSGQKNPVQIHCLVEDDSIESSILKLALNKSEKIDIAVDDHVDAENVVDGNSWWP